MSDQRRLESGGSRSSRTSCRAADRRACAADLSQQQAVVGQLLPALAREEREQVGNIQSVALVSGNVEERNTPSATSPNTRPISMAPTKATRFMPSVPNRSNAEKPLYRR